VRRESSAESREQRAESREQRAESREQRAKSREHRADTSHHHPVHDLCEEGELFTGLKHNTLYGITKVLWWCCDGVRMVL
jgi:hypothetical protein